MPMLDASYHPADPFMAQLRLLKLLVAEGMALPDSVEHDEGELTFLWNEPKLAVVVDLVAQDVRQAESRRAAGADAAAT